MPTKQIKSNIMTIKEFQELPQKDRTYVLTSESSPLSFMLSCRHSKGNELLYYDAEKKMNRAIRYAKNQKSPFVDEQDENFVLEHVTFTDGKLEVPKENPVLQLILSVLHKKNGIDYKELDFEQMAKDEIAQMDVEDKARDIARQLDIETAISILRVHTTARVDSMNSEEIRRDIRVFAKRYPTKFLEAQGDPQLRILSIANKMIDDGTVRIHNNKDVYFNLDTNKSKILTIPFGEDPVNSLCQYLLTEKGLQVYGLMKEKYSM